MTSQRLAAAALSAAIVATPLVAASSASAAPAKSWTTIKKWNGAKQQACKVPVRKGKAFKIYTRLVNGHESAIGAGLQVLKNGEPTKARWDTGDLVPEGKTSKVGVVVIPRNNSAFTLEAFQYEGQMGDGGPVKLKRIGRC
jgi:Ni/Co efflux regulator RcnB